MSYLVGGIELDLCQKFRDKFQEFSGKSIHVKTSNTRQEDVRFVVAIQRFVLSR